MLDLKTLRLTEEEREAVYQCVCSSKEHSIDLYDGNICAQEHHKAGDCIEEATADAQLAKALWKIVDWLNEDIEGVSPAMELRAGLLLHNIPRPKEGNAHGD